MQASQSYVRCDVAVDDGRIQLTPVRFRAVLLQAMRTLFGEVGAAMQVDVLEFDEPRQHAVLRVPADGVTRLWSALTLVTEFDKKPCRVRVLTVAGSLSSLALDSRDFCRRHALGQWDALPPEQRR
tara:strand:+ start:1200 stop:1577 length:378 start_codon:yes stop_codon:yes gene_type:complete